jgi:hypothetical protein
LNDKNLSKLLMGSLHPIEIPEESVQMVSGSFEMYRALFAGDLAQSIEEAKKGGAWIHALAQAFLIDHRTFQDTVYLYALTLPEGSAVRTLYFLFAGKQEEALGNMFYAISMNPELSWRQQLALLVAHRAHVDDEIFLRFGDQLWQWNMIVPAHIAYLLGNNEMDPMNAQNRVTLLAVDKFRYPFHYWNDVNALQITEVFEGIRKRGNPQFSMPYLIIYKMVYTCLLCEYGLIERAKR